MNTQKILIGIFAVIGIIALIIWLVKKFGNSGNNTITPSNTDTTTTTITPRTATTGRNTYQPNQMATPINTQRFAPGVNPGNAARVVGGSVQN